METEDFRIKLGRLSGLVSVISFLVVMPILIILHPNFNKSIIYFDPISKLGLSPETSTYFNIFLVFNGIFLYNYYSFNLANSRDDYNKFKAWKYSVYLGKISGLGLIGIGVFANSKKLHAIHIWSGILFFGGMVLVILITSMDLDNLFRPNRYTKNMLRFSYFLFILGILYPFYFAFSVIKGIWQLFLLIMIIGWHILESNFHSKLRKKIILVPTVQSSRYPFTKLLIVSFILGIALLIQGIWLLFTQGKSLWDGVITIFSSIILIWGSIFVFKKNSLKINAS